MFKVALRLPSWAILALQKADRSWTWMQMHLTEMIWTFLMVALNTLGHPSNVRMRWVK